MTQRRRGRRGGSRKDEEAAMATATAMAGREETDGALAARSGAGCGDRTDGAGALALAGPGGNRVLARA